MPVIDLSDFNTQLEPMKAISTTLDEWEQGFISGIEALKIIDCIRIEWEH